MALSRSTARASEPPAGPTARAGARRTPRLILEWLVLTFLVGALSVWLGQGPRDSVAGRFVRLDAAIFDQINRWRVVPWPRNATLVEIDEVSLARIGRWPWPRAIHAALIESLSNAGARVIGLDILLAEDAIDDEMLVAALATAPTTVLAVASEMDREQREWPIYPVVTVDGVTRLGHVHFGFDLDGIVRGLHLVENGVPAFSLALFEHGGGTSGQRTVAEALAEVRGRPPDARPRTGHDGRFVLLPRLDPRGERVSYADLLTGEVPVTRLRGRTVVIGTTAAGMRDAYSNGLIEDLSLAPGALLHVAALGAIEQSMLATRIAPSAQAGIALLIVLGTMATLYRSRPRAALVAVSLAMLASLALSAALLQTRIWLPPGGILLALLVAYPLWSWRRLETLVAALGRQIAAMGDLPDALRAASRGNLLRARLRAEDPPPGGRPGYSPPAEPISEAVAALQLSAASAATLRELLATGLERLPHGALIVAADGDVLIRNRRAREAFAELDTTPADGLRWLARTFGVAEQALIDGGELKGVECQDRHGRDWLLDASVVHPSGLPALWLIQFSDVTALRALQRQREDMLRFLSHDLRSPQVSILAAIGDLSPGDRTEALIQIEALARRSLELADGFVQWTSAEHKMLEPESADLVELVTQAVESCWADARRVGLTPRFELPDQAAVRVDANLVRLAVVNLVENAIKYGSAGQELLAAVEAEGETWRVTIADRGDGLPPGDPDELFTPYSRGSRRAQGPGSGLGLAFVRLVARRHGGQARARSRPGGGACFDLLLPADRPEH